MRPFDLNQMFVLALVAISIVGVVCLGLLLLLAIILHQRQKQHPKDYTPENGNTKTGTEKGGGEVTGNISLSLSDWVTFLSGEKFGVGTIYFSFLALAVSLFSIIYVSVNNQSWWIPIVGLLFVLFVGYMIFLGAAHKLQQRGKVAEGLLDKVMKKEITEEEQISRDWKNQINKIMGEKPKKRA